MTRDGAIARATRHYDDGSFLTDLARRVAIHTDSQVPQSVPQLHRYLAEDIGSRGLNEFCEQNMSMLAAGMRLGSDGRRLSATRPTIYMGTRGAISFDMTVDLREGGHHSGNWGGLLANPGIILAHALASII